MTGQQQQVHHHADKTWDVIIIGGGLAGLAASVYLARGGHFYRLWRKDGVLSKMSMDKKKSEA